MKPNIGVPLGIFGVLATIGFGLFIKGYLVWAFVCGGGSLLMLAIALINWFRYQPERPDVALVWDWTAEGKGRHSFLGNTEKSIFVDNRNDQTIGRVCINPIPLHCPLIFDEINEIPSKSRGLAAGRWKIASDNKSTTMDGYHQYMQTFDDGLKERGWEHKKPHNRGMSSTFAEIPMAVTFDWQNATWKIEFSWHYDAGDDEIFFIPAGRFHKVRRRRSKPLCA
jgi:hypothetical protein